ncbi:MAG: ribbon-helix-helix domain-containing protein [Alphaproteobacteria bacterium]
MSALKSRNVRVGARRTSVRLEPELWAALELIASREGSSVHQICTNLAADKASIRGGLTSALRVYIVQQLQA